MEQIFEFIRPQLQRVEERLLQQGKAFDREVEGYVLEVMQAGGKRIRPGLALLAGGVCGSIEEKHLDLAVILELIHVASLVHDDMMDGATLRREHVAAHAKWGNSLSVLLGDSLFTHAMRLATEFEDPYFSRQIAEAAFGVCSGEILQMQRRFDSGLPIEEYFRIIEMKTAMLFAAACELAAYLSGASKEVQGVFKSFGKTLGIVYQIYDDCLDLVGQETKIGKTLGTDLQKGKYTLPVLLMFQNREHKDWTYFQGLMSERNSGKNKEAVAFLCEAGMIQEAVGIARGLLKQSLASFSVFAQNAYSKGLVVVVSYLDGLLAGLA